MWQDKTENTKKNINEIDTILKQLLKKRGLQINKEQLTSNETAKYKPKYAEFKTVNKNNEGIRTTQAMHK